MLKASKLRQTSIVSIMRYRLCRIRLQPSSYINFKTIVFYTTRLVTSLRLPQPMDTCIRSTKSVLPNIPHLSTQRILENSSYLTTGTQYCLIAIDVIWSLSSASFKYVPVELFYILSQIFPTNLILNSDVYLLFQLCVCK